MRDCEVWTRDGLKMVHTFYVGMLGSRYRVPVGGGVKRGSYGRRVI